MNKKNQGGFILVVVLWILAILTIVVVGFYRRAVLDARASVYTLDRSIAMMAARGAVHRGMIELSNKVFLDYLQKEERGATHLGQAWAKQKNMYGEYFTAGPGFEEDVVGYIIEDMERYIDINRAGLELLAGIGPISATTRRKIMARRVEGVQDGEPPVAFHAPEELRYLSAIDEEDWFGTQDDPGLIDLVTTLGGPKININTASAAVLACIPDIGKGAIKDLIAYRGPEDGELGTSAFKGFNKIGDAASLAGLPLSKLAKYCKVSSQYFKIRGVATRRQGKIRAEAVAIVRAVDGSGAVQLLGWREGNFGF